MRSWLDEAELVHIAATATGRPPEAVLTGTDVAALAHVVVGLEQAPNVVEAAATAVLEIGRRRPFGDGSPAAAWLAAAHLLSLDELRLGIGPVGAAGVLAADERVGVAEVAAVLLEHSAPRRSRTRRLLGLLFEAPRPDGPSLLPCPACGRPLVRRRHDITAAGPWSSTAVAQRVARCAVEHRTHDRWARELVPA